MSHPNNRLSLLCRATRLRAALTVQPSASVSHHCATCADCRAYFDTANQVETSLRREAAARTTNAPGSLESRIFRAIEHSRTEEHRPRLSFTWGIAALAGAAVVAVATLQIQDRPSTNTSQPAGSVEDVLAVASELPKKWFATVQPGATKLLEENPLQTEIASVSSDARSALDFLAMNFLPADRQTRPATLNPSQNGS